MGCCKKRTKPTGMDKLKSILEGWSNVIWSSPIVKEVATLRAEVCAGCDCNNKNWCSECGCYIPAKARSLSEVCEKWDNIDEKYNL